MPTDWLQLWRDFESKTGRPPSEDSKGFGGTIYLNVRQGAAGDREGYREFFDSRRWGNSAVHGVAQGSVSDQK